MVGVDVGHRRSRAVSRAPDRGGLHAAGVSPARLHRPGVRDCPPVCSRPRRLSRQHVREPPCESDRGTPDVPAVVHALQPLGSRAQPHASRLHEPQGLRLRVDADVADGIPRGAALAARDGARLPYRAKLIFPSRAHVPEPRPEYRRDSLAVTAFAAVQLAGYAAAAHLTRQPAWSLVAFGVALPFVLWNALMGFAI